MEKPCLCPSEGHKYGGRIVIETSVTEFLLLKRKIIALEIRYIEIKEPCRAKTL